MNWLDLIIIIVAIVFAVVGLWRGAIKAAFGIVGLVGGIALAGRCYQTLANVLSSNGATWAKIAAYAIILVATLVIAGIIGRIIARLAHITMLGWVDRLVGFILGAVIGSMLFAAFLAIVCKYLPDTEAVIAQSVLARFLMEQIPLLLALLPEDFDFIKDFFTPSRHIY